MGALRVVIAVPSNRTLSAVKDSNDSNANIVGSFKLMTSVNAQGATVETVPVEGAEGYTATAYKVYYLDYANPNDTANKYLVTIA